MNAVTSVQYRSLVHLCQASAPSQCHAPPGWVTTTHLGQRCPSLMPCVSPLMPSISPLMPCVSPLMPRVRPLKPCVSPLMPCVRPLMLCALRVTCAGHPVHGKHADRDPAASTGGGTGARIRAAPARHTASAGPLWNVPVGGNRRRLVIPCVRPTTCSVCCGGSEQLRTCGAGAAGGGPGGRCRHAAPGSAEGCRKAKLTQSQTAQSRTWRAIWMVSRLLPCRHGTCWSRGCCLDSMGPDLRSDPVPLCCV
mmetsp:Transcript_13434/g.38955  ORF Transcript_13434/g.38955 Transcript_13434/m.38955 type:complete len:251 (+) Transcript_13434:468-1220(+)